MKNPLKIMHYDCHIGLTQLMLSTRLRDIKRSTIRKLVAQDTINPHMHKRLFPAAMIAWGNAVNHNNTEAADKLWKCYFDTQPHIYHLLCYVFNIPDKILMKAAGMKSHKTLAKILRRKKVSRKHLRMIGPYAIKYIDALYSDRAGGGRDHRYAKLHLALHDPERVYQRGEIIED